MRVIEIAWGQPYPAGELSNLFPHDFVFRGLPVASMEGLLQGSKFARPAEQRAVLRLSGRAARLAGQEQPWQRDHRLYWQGAPMGRFGVEYQAFLDEAFAALFTQSAAARAALLATRGAVLTHPMGAIDPHATVLTQAEFLARLTRLRRELAP